ncbi:MAG: hypothetical protein ACLTMP_10920 [Eggerthella lenta]
MPTSTPASERGVRHEQPHERHGSRCAGSGADIRLSTKCEKLVADGGRVVGVVAKGPDGKERYVKAEKRASSCARAASA